MIEIVDLRGVGGAVALLFPTELWTVRIVRRDHAPEKALEPEFYVYLNEQRIRTLPGVEEADYGVYQYRCESITLEETVNVGDKIAVSFACRDPYVLHYEFPLYEWVAEEGPGAEGSPYTAEGYTVSGSNTPILSWE